MILHCLFEQSGTFKQEARKLGLQSYDYDIRNDFGQTDFRTNLFEEINKAYVGQKSIFDMIRPQDYAIAFFPCTRFSKQMLLWFKGAEAHQKNWTLEQKLRKVIGLHSELDDYYILITKLVLIALKRKFKLIIENPYSSSHYLTRYWPIQPSFVEADRHKYGDYYQKPTQFFFINCEPNFNLVLEDGCLYELEKVNDQNSLERSMISPEYANRFIREMILPKEVNDEI